MERQVPRRVPGVLPLVWHRDNLLVHHVKPFTVPDRRTVRVCRPCPVLLEPFGHVETEILLGPQHPGQSLTHDHGSVFANAVRSDGSIELVRLRSTGPHDFRESLTEWLAHFFNGLIAKPQRDGDRLPCANDDLVMSRGLRTVLLRISCFLPPRDYAVI